MTTTFTTRTPTGVFTIANLPYGADSGLLGVWNIERKAVRQLRKTTDRRYTTVGIADEESRSLNTYTCKGCGKTSTNGGAFGFHVRSCQALDRFDVDARCAYCDSHEHLYGECLGDECGTCGGRIVGAGEERHCPSCNGETPIRHRHIMGGGQLVCRDCGSETFWDLGRSLFNHNFACTGCGRTVSPLTETGASQ